ncbi:MAG: zinc-binding dehydrogenase [Actinomycetota bacterium]
MRAAVLRAMGAPLTVEDVTLGPPAAGEVLVRVAVAGVCHSDLHLAEGHLGSNRVPIVLGHEGAGIVEAVGAGVTSHAPGDRVAFCFVPACGTCRQCLAGRRNLCERAGDAAWRGTMPDGTTRLRTAEGDRLLHFNFVSCFAERSVVPASSAVVLPAELPLWQGALIGCGVVTAYGAVRDVARVSPGDSVCVIGCGGVGLHVVAAARLAGASTIVAVDRGPDKLERSRRFGATHTVDAATADVVATVRDLSDGGVDHAIEVVGLAETIRQAWDVLRPGATAVVVGLAPRGVEVTLPALDLLSEKGLKGSYYGSGDPAARILALAELAAAGEIDMGSAVSDVTDLSGIQEAFERLRRGEGARTVAVLDPELAGDVRAVRR